MSSTQLISVADLPAAVDLLADDDWTRDLVETSRELLRREDIGLLRGPENSVLALRNSDVKALAANPNVGNMPAEVLFWMATEMNVGAEIGTKPEPEQTDGFRQFLRNQVFTSNPPLHQQSRNTLARQLMPRNVRQFVPDAERLARELVAESAGAAQIDFSREFAGRFVTRFWAEQFGLPRSQAEHLQELVEEMNLSFLVTRTPEQSQRLYSAVAAYMDLVGQAAKRAWAGGNNELLTSMADDLAKVDLDGKPEDIGTYVAANFFDGFHTVGVAIANVVFRLLSDDAAHAQVRADQSLVTHTFYEGTRLESPLMLSFRLALRDIEHDGVLIPAWTPIGMAWVAANRDPAVFADPDSYVLNRPIQHGATFGGGAHICPGRNVARMLTEVAVTALTASDVDITLVEHEPEWAPDSLMRHLTTMPVTIRRVSR